MRVWQYKRNSWWTVWKMIRLWRGGQLIKKYWRKILCHADQNGLYLKISWNRDTFGHHVPNIFCLLKCALPIDAKHVRPCAATLNKNQHGYGGGGGGYATMALSPLWSFVNFVQYVPISIHTKWAFPIDVLRFSPKDLTKQIPSQQTEPRGWNR